MQFNLKNIFLTGLAVIVPVGLTVYILVFLIGMMDGLLTFIPQKYHPTTLIGFHIPGLGIIITILLIFICGLMTKSIIGKRIVLAGLAVGRAKPPVRQAICQHTHFLCS